MAADLAELARRVIEADYGREYVPGVIHRSDRMASTGLYDDGKLAYVGKGAHR